MKKFFKPTIQNKILVAILPKLILQVIIIGGITLLFSVQEYNSNVTQYIKQVKYDIFFLAENQDIWEYLENLHYELDEEKQNKIEDIENLLFERLILRKEIYERIVYIDINGDAVAEKVSGQKKYKYKNINFSNNQIFLEAKKLGPNQVIIKSLSKNLQRFYTPVYLDLDGDGTPEMGGVIIFETNYPWENFIKSALLSTVLIVFLLLISLYIIKSTINVVKKLVEPIESLVGATKALSSGNLNVRTDVVTDDEIGILANSFNQMANDLQSNINELEIYKNELEQKVTDRTKKLQESNHELSEAYKKLKSTQAQLIHSGKMASLGQLVAGVAHELNNPINFIYANMPHLSEYIEIMKDVIQKYSQSKLEESDQNQINELKESYNWDFILPDLDVLICDCKNGADRVKKIVSDLKDFSRLGEAEYKVFDIHQGIDTTLNILVNSYKNRVKVEKVYCEDGNIEGFPDQLNQVFMNLLSNAEKSMIQEKIDSGEATVHIETIRDADTLKIIIEDNGCGISDDNFDKIFDPFFTTRSVGEGTGLGLSITYGIIEKHSGKIEVESKVNKGTKFTITLPLKQNTLTDTDNKG